MAYSPPLAGRAPLVRVWPAGSGGGYRFLKTNRARPAGLQDGPSYLLPSQPPWACAAQIRDRVTRVTLSLRPL